MMMVIMMMDTTMKRNIGNHFCFGQVKICINKNCQ
jgi:hypothetical protein